MRARRSARLEREGGVKREALTRHSARFSLFQPLLPIFLTTFDHFLSLLTVFSSLLNHFALLFNHSLTIFDHYFVFFAVFLIASLSS